MSDLPGPEKPLFDAAQMMSIGVHRNGAPLSRHAPKKVRPRHRLVVQLAECGYSNNEISELTGYTPSRVSVILNFNHPVLEKARHEFTNRVVEQITDLGTRFRHHAIEALDVTVKVMRQTEDLSQARLAARDILDRAGYAPVKKQINFQAPVPIDELREIVGKIQNANEAVEGRERWAVKSIPVKTA